MSAAGLKRSRFGRALSLSRLGAQVALKQGRILLSRKDELLHRQVADTMVRELGQLKGLPMKIGQILSYMDGVVPDEVQAIYQDALGALRTTSEPMPAAVCREVIEAQLGAAPEKLFDRFDQKPLASASIGQVHRASFEGREVCVKVQYPGIADAIKADLRNIDSIVGLMRRTMPHVDTEQMIRDFRDRLAEECDYTREADYQRKFAAIYAGDPDILVPAVIDARTAEKVITTAFVEGRGYDAFLADASQEARDRAGMALFRFAFRTLLEHGLFHADPHPGNLIFEPPGATLCVLDYGCVQPMSDEARRDIRALLEVALVGGDLAEPAAKALGITAMDDATARVVTDLVAQVLEPVTAPQPYTFTRAMAAGIAKQVVEAKKSLATRYLTRRGRFVAEREGVMFVVRNLFGLGTIWGTLGSRGDFRALTRAMIDAMDDG